MREARKAKLVVGLFLAAALGVFAYLSLALGGFSLKPRIHGSAVFDDVTGLVPGARVTVAGVPVGLVRTLTVVDGKARVDFILYAGHGLTAGAVADVRARSLLGEKYLAIDPAPAPGSALADGFTLPARPSAPSIDTLLAKLGPMIDKLPIDELATDLKRVDEVLRKVLPAVESGQGVDLAELTRAAKTLSDTLEAERPALHDALTAVALVAKDLHPGAKETMGDLADTLENLRDISERLAKVDTGNANEDLALLKKSLERLPQTLDNVDRTLSTLQKLDPILERLGKIDDEELRRLLREEGVRIRFTKP
ncbi:MAG: MlaD family protein [Acidobacteriota bacterium]